MYDFNLHPRPLKSGFTQDWRNFPSGRDHSAKGAGHAQIYSSIAFHFGKVKEFTKNLVSSRLFNTNICFFGANIRNFTLVKSHTKQTKFVALRATGLAHCARR